MKSAQPWINFNGNAEEAFQFYRTVFGGEFKKIVRFEAMAGGDFQIPESEAKKIMYIALPLGTHTLLVGNDVPSFMGKVNENENRSKILVSTESKEEADEIFSKLSEGGEVEGPIAEGPWATYAGMFRDKFGIEWIIEFDPS